MRRLLSVVLTLGLIVAGVSIFGALAGSLSVYLDLAGQFAIQGTIIAALAVILFAIMRHPSLAAAALVLTLVGFLAVRPHSEIASCEALATHKVVFLNIWASNPDPAQSVAYLARSNADAILVGEVSPHAAQALTALRNDYPFALECPVKDWGCDVALYSRYPISKTSLSHQRLMVGADVQFPEGTVNITAVHLARPWPFTAPRVQLRQTDRIAKVIAQTSQPRIVLGDFNAVTWGEVTRRIGKTAQIFALPSRGTWHTDFPWPFRVPIDQALVGKDLKCASKAVGPRVSSDHRAIAVEFAIARAR